MSRKTLLSLQKCKFIKPTEIQRQSIGYALQGRDVLGAAITGSGKTLAFLIPVMENLFVKKWVRQDGVGAIIISPTRELAYQIFETLKKVGAHHDFSAGLIIGGKNLKFERSRMDQCNVIICTPGRLLQHMDENPLFNCSTMQMLVLDEADRCLDMGFHDEMNAIIENLPPERQTLLFSATQTKSVKDLARLSLHDPVYVAPHEQQAIITPAALKQNYVVVELEEKLTMLWSFIKNHLKQKTIVFMATCKQVKYVNEIFSKLRPGVKIFALYGTLHQEKRMAIYDEFCRKSRAVLLATDLAARGLDIPAVNWSIQLDCPADPNEYIHRAGRTARNAAHGESLLVLLPSEEDGMIEELRTRKIPINKIHVDPKKMFTPRAKLEAFLAQNKELKESAQRALINYVKSVALMKDKNIFKVETLNIEGFAQSLGLMFAPRVKFLQGVKYFAEKKRSEAERQTTNVDNDADLRQKLEMKDSDESDSEQSDGDEENESESGSESDSESGPDSENDAVQKPVQKSMGIFNESTDSSDDDENSSFMRIKRRDHEIEEDTLPEVPDLNEIKSKKQQNKVVTKAAIAKKLIKKKILPNKKVEFDEEGNEVERMNKLKSELAKEYEQSADCGIDISKARELIKQEDKFDKERFKQMVKAKHRAKKLKTKKDSDNDEQDDFGSDSDDDGANGPDLSWLPDPDKIYNKNSDVSDSDDSDNEYKMNGRQVVNSSSESSDDSETYIDDKPTFMNNKREHQTSKAVIDSGQSDDEPKTSEKIRKITSKLTVDDAESFAMQLLSK